MLDVFSGIDWAHVLSVVAAFLVGIVVKTLLDLRLALFLIKYFWWVRPRWIFGENRTGLLVHGNTFGIQEAAKNM